MSDSVKTPLTLAELDFIEAELKQWSVTDYGDVLEPFLPRLLSMARQSVEGEAVAAEDRAEQFIQAAISNAAEPLKELGQYLTSVLDEDEWPTAERYLLALAAPPPAAAVTVRITADASNKNNRRVHLSDGQLCKVYGFSSEEAQAKAEMIAQAISRLSPDTQGGAGAGQDVVEAAPIIRDWIQDDAPLALKMIITPALVDALANRLRAALTAGSAEG